MARVVFICLVTIASLVSVYGQDCDFGACTATFTPLQQQPGSFSLRKFNEECRIFPNVSACMESKMLSCGFTDTNVDIWELTTELIQLMCYDRRSDYVEASLCLDTNASYAAVQICSQQMLRNAVTSVNCSLVTEYTDCIIQIVRPCGEKAVDIMYIMYYNTAMIVLRSFNVEGCSRETRPTTTTRRTTVTTTNMHDATLDIFVAHSNAGPTTWPHIAAFCGFLAVLFILYD